MTFGIDNPWGLQHPPFGKYVWKKRSGKLGLIFISTRHALHLRRITCILWLYGAAALFLSAGPTPVASGLTIHQNLATGPKVNVKQDVEMLLALSSLPKFKFVRKIIYLHHCNDFLEPVAK